MKKILSLLILAGLLGAAPLGASLFLSPEEAVQLRKKKTLEKKPRRESRGRAEDMNTVKQRKMNIAHRAQQYTSEHAVAISAGIAGLVVGGTLLKSALEKPNVFEKSGWYKLFPLGKDRLERRAERLRTANKEERVAIMKLYGNWYSDRNIDRIVDESKKPRSRD